MSEKTYEVLVGIDFPPLQRREPGETVTEKELPAGSAKWLIEVGSIKPINSKKKDK